MLNTLRKDNLNYVARNSPLPHSYKYVVDRFALVNPDEVVSGRERVLYALWHVGELPYYELLLYADIDKNELDAVLSELLDNALISTPSIQVISGTSEPDYSAYTFRLIR